MIRRANDHGIDLSVHLIEHLSKIFIAFCLREAFEGRRGVRVVHIAQGHNIFTGHTIDISGAPPPHADAGNIKLFIGLGTPCRSTIGQENETLTAHSYVAQEITTI